MLNGPRFLKHDGGLTLIEVLAAIVILGVALSGIAKLFAMTAEQNRFGEEQQWASSIAQSEIAKMGTSGVTAFLNQQQPDVVKNGTTFHTVIHQVQPLPAWARTSGLQSSNGPNLVDVEVDVSWATSFHGVKKNHQVTYTQLFSQ
ncbi:prepilin-type N-terminal cleavage/methylation domain-containing protein [Alicyclobacillus sp. SO9]|uniref:type IV pilus modification PilV family protein n=1 Tax=Alicyclobacillus sp. SO9 TaxID=2665646 RepID=UPI0018E8046C|nr:prepilin-type N-terminal cleavage/methylation domain-containing protein [Alicyclobacillus sp. SO9]QQE77549.1 prepilin-type N-terminal cleavage/methylation domain-containing protein [Alicyclobacillus sp. SO9]